MTKDTYSKRILVTGGAGFIGSTFLNMMVPKYSDYHFINFDALTEIADINNVIVNQSENYTFIHGDIRDKKLLRETFNKYQVTDVIHFAAESHVDVSINEPGIFVETNIVGTSNLLVSALSNKINRFFHISTDEVYGALQMNDPAFTEETSLAPNSPYSASKAGADMLVRSFNKTYGLDTIITRCSNNYGPRQDLTKFIPKAISSVMSGKNIPVYGKGEQVRDWLYVEDHVHAIDLAFHSGVSGEIYNIGGGVELPNIEIAKKITNRLDRPDAIEFVPDRKGHDFRYAIDDSKIRSLGYSPQTSFDVGFEKTLKWYKK